MSGQSVANVNDEGVAGVQVPQGLESSDPLRGSSPAGKPSRRRPLLRYLARRLGIALVLAFSVSLLVFAAMQILPGDTARAALGGGRATEEQLATVRDQLGLNEPPLSRYWDWLSGLFHGDLGNSLISGRPVTEIVADPFRNSLVLAATTIVILIPLALALGTWCGLHKGHWIDTFVAGATLGGISIPEFVVGSVLILIFALRFEVLPPVSLIPPGETALSTPEVLVLPVCTLLVIGLAYTTRLMRASVADVAATEFARLAELQGLPRRTISTQVVIRNSLAGAIQSVAQTVMGLLGGVVVTEAVFGYPGLGTVLVQAVSDRDFPMVQSLVFLIALTFIAINALADVAVVAIVPRLRTAA